MGMVAMVLSGVGARGVVGFAVGGVGARGDVGVARDGVRVVPEGAGVPEPVGVGVLGLDVGVVVGPGLGAEGPDVGAAGLGAGVVGIGFGVGLGKLPVSG